MVLVLAASSVRADDLQLHVMQDELLSGEYYLNNSNSTWYINVSAKVEGKDIYSACCEDDYIFQIISCAHGMPL